MIVERQDAEGRGKAMVENLATDLRADFPGVGGLSASNVWRMKVFLAYQGVEKLAPLVREIGWSHTSSSWSAVVIRWNVNSLSA